MNQVECKVRKFEMDLLRKFIDKLFNVKEITPLFDDDKFDNEEWSMQLQPKKIIMLTGTPGAGKTTFVTMMKDHLEAMGFVVWVSPSISTIAKKEFEIWQKDLKNETFFYISELLHVYENMVNDLFDNMYKYDYVIFDRTHLDTKIATLMYVEDKTKFAYLEKRCEMIKFDTKFINKIIYFKPSFENVLKRQKKRAREGETVDEEYFKRFYSLYEKNINEIYSEYETYVNNGSVEEYYNYFIKLI